MLSSIQKTIIIRAVRIRMEKGEKPEDILRSYSRLTEGEREEVLRLACEGQPAAECGLL